jgi:archaeosine-15-forming tRNA-guanine transglycosylase
MEMKPKFRVILEQAIEEGVRMGYRRAFKHVENPSEGAIIEHIEEQVMSSIYEYFTFDEENF